MEERFEFSRRNLEMNILPTRNEMGRAAARDVVRVISRFIKEKGKKGDVHKNIN